MEIDDSAKGACKQWGRSAFYCRLLMRRTVTAHGAGNMAAVGTKMARRARSHACGLTGYAARIAIQSRRDKPLTGAVIFVLIRAGRIASAPRRVTPHSAAATSCSMAQGPPQRNRLGPHCCQHDPFIYSHHEIAESELSRRLSANYFAD